MLYSLSQARLPIGILLHCARSANFRKLYTGHLSTVAERLKPWTTFDGFSPTDSTRWLRIWRYQRASNEACLLWKILYGANATQRRHFPTLHYSDPQLQCPRCVAFASEDEEHLFWRCPYSQRLWQWLFYIFWLRARSDWVPDFNHAILGAALPCHLRLPQPWWELLRGSLIWRIWLQRNGVVFQTPAALTSQASIASGMWIQLRAYIRNDYSKLKRRILTVSAERTIRLKLDFEYRWGEPPLDPTIHGSSLLLPSVPALVLLYWRIILTSRSYFFPNPEAYICIRSVWPRTGYHSFTFGNGDLWLLFGRPTWPL
jgi:hypothetical protein